MRGTIFPHLVLMNISKEYGPIPHIYGIKKLNFEAKKALTAAAANYGCPLLFIEEHTISPENSNYQAKITFTKTDLDRRYQELAPTKKVDLVTIGCPQASFDEIQRTAEYLIDNVVPDNRLWIFTSSANFDKAKDKGLVDKIEEAGGLMLQETCPEVVHYNHEKVKHILTNSMKAEHYLKSGLNAIDTSVAKLEDCIKFAAKPELLEYTKKEEKMDKNG